MKVVTLIKIKLFSLVILTAFIMGGCNEDILRNPESGLTNEEIIKGLREALTVGTDSTVKQVNALDGYFKNELIRIVLPPEAQQVQKIAGQFPIVKTLLDTVVLKMNRSAEAAAKEATPIFKDAILKMTIVDGYKILKGTDTAATNYLRVNTFSPLQALYKPKVESAMTEIGVQQTWGEIVKVVDTYNQIPLVEKITINRDISQYVTGKALHGLFIVVGQKERDIRKDPVKRVTDILRKVFDPNVK
jgi:hypothetical protein